MNILCTYVMCSKSSFFFFPLVLLFCIILPLSLLNSAFLSSDFSILFYPAIFLCVCVCYIVPFCIFSKSIQWACCISIYTYETQQCEEKNFSIFSKCHIHKCILYTSRLNSSVIIPVYEWQRRKTKWSISSSKRKKKNTVNVLLLLIYLFLLLNDLENVLAGSDTGFALFLSLSLSLFTPNTYKEVLLHAQWDWWTSVYFVHKSMWRRKSTEIFIMFIFMYSRKTQLMLWMENLCFGTKWKCINVYGTMFVHMCVCLYLRKNKMKNLQFLLIFVFLVFHSFLK